MKFENEENELKISFEAFKKRVLEDYRLAVLSRECSLLGRREVFSGKGKFGIFGDGKELPQLAMNHFFQNGDFQSVENLIYDNPYSYQIHNFCDWVTENKRTPQFPSHTVDDTLFNMQILDAWKSR